jgi:hypothetical protein
MVVAYHRFAWEQAKRVVLVHWAAVERLATALMELDC